jgi:hypothetical protein
MAKHYTKDMMTGRVTEARSETFDLASFQARRSEQNRQQDMITARAERLAIQAGFTRTEFRTARASTRLRWQTKALDALTAEGHVFDPIIDELNRPV